MQRLTISVDDELAEAFDRLIASRQYKNRSEAVRDLLRRELAEQAMLKGQGECVAVVSYSYDHHSRQLSSRMIEQQHDHTSLVISTMHVHVSQSDCVEAVVMRGPIKEVEALSESMIAETGIEHGHVHFIPVVKVGGCHHQLHYSQSHTKPSSEPQ